MNTFGNDWWSDRLTRWAELTFPHEPSEVVWATPNECIELKDSVHLRRFGEQTADQADSTPVLIVTPQVNHSYIADFSENQSLARTLLANGSKVVGVTDWQAPPNRPYHIADSLDDIIACIDHLGTKVHLVGLCQGGWQAAMIAALWPDRVATLTLAAAPIDFHAGSTMLHAFTFGLPFFWFENLVAFSGGVAPGKLISQGFDLLRPMERFFLNHIDLWMNIDDAEWTDRRRSIMDWYRTGKDIAGDLYLETVKDLFQENQLALGEYSNRGVKVDLAKIACPVHLVTGTRDHITPPEQTWALEDHAPKATCQRYSVDAGHIGVFMGRGALSKVWPKIASSWN